MEAPVIVTSDTVLRWQRRRFREHWTKLSAPAHRGPPNRQPGARGPYHTNGRGQSALGCPRIHGELFKLGIDVVERTAFWLLPKRRSPPSQTCRTFLDNHLRLVSIDSFTVSTAHLRVFFVLICAYPQSPARTPLQVTEHPKADWRAHQIVDACPEDTAPSLPRARS